MILLFGSNGQLGRELTQMAKERGVPLAGLNSAQADISDRAAVSAAVSHCKPALVVNAAAYTKVDLAETEAEKARVGNETGPAVLAEVCAAADLPLVHISTDYVFDGTKQGTYVESDPVSPLNRYGSTKAAGEGAVRATLRRHIILRTSWVYSAHGQNFLKTMVKLAQTRDELRVVADQHGKPTSAADLADAILRIAPQLLSRDENWGTYHFAGEGTTTWYGFAARIVAAQAPLTGRNPLVTAIGTANYPTPAARPANSELDCTLFSKTFGFKARLWTDAADETTRAVITSQEFKVTHVA